MSKTRTYALVGTGGCGKTTLAEMLLHKAGVLSRQGKIEEGTTALDYEPEEIKKRGSIQPGFASFEHDGFSHFFIDMPGDGNFLGDAPVLLSGVDAVLFVIDAVDGVRPLTKRQWKIVQEAGLPCACVITKLDRENSNFSSALAGLSSLTTAKPVLLYAPIVEGNSLSGLASVFSDKAVFFDKEETREREVPSAMKDEIQLLRELAVENIAETDDALMEQYLEEGMLFPKDIERGLSKGFSSGMLLPVIPASGLEGRGAHEILSLIESYFPSGLDHAPFKAENGTELVPSSTGPAACFVIKTLSDPFAGQLSVVRVLSGTVTSDTPLKNRETLTSERLGTPLLLCGKNQTQSKLPVGPGSIVAFAKLKNTHTGNTLTDDKLDFSLVMPKLPAQLMAYAIAPQQKGDEDKVFAAIQKLLAEDIMLKLVRDEETADILLYGMGQLHIEVSVEKARRRSKVDIVLNTPQIPYRETIKAKAEAQGRHKKQSGGRGQFGDCWVAFEPLPRGAGYVFEDAVVGGAVPKQYIPAVDKGIQEASQRGFLAGFPMVDFTARLYDGSYHSVDSSEMAFKIAGSLAFKKAMETCKPVLLEPIVSLTISLPDESMGDVIGDLSSRRGKVAGTDSQHGITEIKAFVPMNEILRYAPELRSMTGGQGSFTMEFSHYEEAPLPVVDKVLAESAKYNAE